MSLPLSDANVLQHLIQEVAIPIGARRTMSTTEFIRSLSPESNRRRAPRVDLGESDVVVQIENELVRPLDFSIRGVQVQSESRLVPGSSVVMHIRWQEEERLMALGRVMWASFEKAARQAAPLYRSGVLLENADLKAVRSILARCGLGQSVDVRVIYSRR
jgi:hypothetical protein